MKNEIILKNLTSATRKELKIIVAKRLNSSKNEKLKMIKHEKEIISMKKTIRYLHFFVKFFIDNDVEKEFFMKFFSVKFLKSINNKNIFKICAGVTKNTVTNKI